jgi:hypothetical protein
MQQSITKVLLGLTLLTTSVFGMVTNNIDLVRSTIQTLPTGKLKNCHVTALKQFSFRCASMCWYELKKRGVLAEAPDEKFAQELLGLAQWCIDKLVYYKRRIDSGDKDQKLARAMVALRDQLDLTIGSLHELYKKTGLYSDGAFRLGGDVLYVSTEVVFTDGDPKALEVILKQKPTATNIETCAYAVSLSAKLGIVALRYARQKNGQTYCNEYFVGDDRQEGGEPLSKKQKLAVEYTLFEKLCQYFVVKKSRHTPSQKMVSDIRALLTHFADGVVITPQCFVPGAKQEPTICESICEEFCCFGQLSKKSRVPSLTALAFCYVINNALVPVVNVQKAENERLFEKVLTIETLMTGCLTHLVDGLSIPEVLAYLGKLIAQCDSQVATDESNKKEKWLELSDKVKTEVNGVLNTMLSKDNAFFCKHARISWEYLKEVRFREWIFMGMLNNWFCWNAETACLEVRKEADVLEESKDVGFMAIHSDESDTDDSSYSEDDSEG